MELFIYSGIAHGQLPSIDLDCLRIMAYIKFKEIPVRISTNGNPFHSPNGFLPYLKDNDEIIAGYDDIIAYFQSKDYDSEDFTSTSYMCQFELQLLPYFRYVLWGDPQNADEIRTLYAKRLPFPLNFVYPHRYVKHTSEFLKVVSNFSIDDKLEQHNTADLILKAKMYVNMLVERIEGKRGFFGGQKPNEFDATIYASLSILLNLPLSQNILKGHIMACPNLVAYVDRIRKKFMAGIQNDVTEPNKTTFLSRIHGVFINKDKGTISNGMVKVMFGLLTVSTMVFFAISHGILEIITDDDDMDSLQYYDGDDDDSGHFSED